MVKALRAGAGEALERLKERQSEFTIGEARELKKLLVEYGDIDLGPLESVRVFPVLYIFMDLDLRAALTTRILGKVLVGLRDGVEQGIYRESCTSLLNALARKIAEPERFLSIVKKVDTGSQYHKRHQLSLEVLLQDYESLHGRVRAVWEANKHQSLKSRQEALYSEFPELDQGKNGVWWRDDSKPQGITLRLLARWKGTNTGDVKRALSEARKIRRALEVVGVEYAPPVSYETVKSVSSLLGRSLRTTYGSRK